MYTLYILYSIIDYSDKSKYKNYEFYYAKNKLMLF